MFKIKNASKTVVSLTSSSIV